MNEEVPPALAGLHAWAESVELSPVGMAIAESRYAFAIIEGAHLIGLAVAVGLLFVVDLRMLGVLLRKVPARRVLDPLRPWILGGFTVVFLTGALLFWSSAARMVLSPAFPIKMLFILLAGFNALWFELAAWQRQGAARVAGATSLGLWCLVIVFGRLIPYLPSWYGVGP